MTTTAMKLARRLVSRRRPRAPEGSGTAPPAAALLALAIVLAVGSADARQTRMRHPLATIGGLTSMQVATLQQHGIRSIAALGAASPVTLTRALAIELAAATRLVDQAKAETGRLRLVYADARPKFPYSRPVGESPAPSPEEQYAELISPTNECTILVRKVCGLQNQCAAAPGCPLATQLLATFNTNTDRTPAAEACVIALEDSLVFPQCSSR